MQENVKRTIEALQQNGFGAVYFKTAQEAKQYLLEVIDKEATIGFGGSKTLDQMGIFPALKERGNKALWHWYLEEGRDRDETMKEEMTANVYLSGINGLTEDGRIINIDGTGNRLAGMLFGHDQLYLVAGINKISRNYEDAMIRIKNVACPLNTQRLNYSTPCAILGKCMSCTGAERICNATLIMERQHGGIPTTVVLIDESLGF